MHTMAEGGNALTPLIYNFAIEYTISKVHENQVGLKFNEIHQLLVYIDEVNRLGDIVDVVKKNTQTLIDASEEVGLDANCFSLVGRMQGKITT
jgi:hypothetical protein